MTDPKQGVTSSLSPYIRIALLLLVTLGLAGELAGKREQAFIIFIITSIVWSSIRILEEGFAAIYELINKGKGTPPTDPTAKA